MIPVDVNHDRPVGEVKYLELGRSGKLAAVCEIDAAGLDQGPWFFSPEILHRRGKDIELRAVAITKKPACIALGPITAHPGTLADAARTIVYQDGWEGMLIQRAAEYDRARKRGEPLTVHDRNPRTASAALASPRPSGRIEYRSAGHINQKDEVLALIRSLAKISPEVDWAERCQELVGAGWDNTTRTMARRLIEKLQAELARLVDEEASPAA